MEFARRGPATASVDEDVVEERRRSLDPPSQPPGDAMLVIRDALLLQLQQYRLRQEIIMAELVKIDRAMALSSATCHGAVTGDVEWTKLPSFSSSEKIMPHGRWPVSLEHWANVDCHHDLKEDARQGGAKSGVVKSAMQDHASDKKLEENATSDTQKLEEYNENVQKESSKWELTEITMPVKKPKSPQKWTCTICHVETISEQQLQEHYGGRKHRSNMAMLESRNKNISQTAETAVEPSVYAGLKTCPIKWSCSACQANGTSEADLKEHLNSSTHQLSIEEQCKEGDNMTKAAELPEAKSHQSNVLQHEEKQHQLKSSSICQAICTRESELGSHLSENSLHEINNISRNSESPGAKLPPNNVPQSAEQTSNCSIYQANCDHQSGMVEHLGEMIHQPKIQAQHEEAKQTKTVSPRIDKNQPGFKWECSICEAKCYTESIFEHHISGKKHQRKIMKKIKALQLEGAKARLHALKMENKGPSDGSDNMSATREVVEQMTPCVSDVCNSLCGSETIRAGHFSGEEHQEKQKNFCEVCDLQCNSEKMLVHHRTGKKHLKKLKAKQ